MALLLADENFNDDMLQGVRDYDESLVFPRVREAGLESQPDEVVLEWAADNGYVVVTHDVKTMIHFAKERIQSGLPRPGLVVVQARMPYREAIDELVMIALCGDASDFRDQVIYLPL